MILNHSFPGGDQFILMISMNIQSERGGQQEAWTPGDSVLSEVL